MIFAVTMAVLLPNEPEWLQVFRAKHMAHEPHITLVQPRNITSAQHEEIRQLLADYMASKSFPDHRIPLRFHDLLGHDGSDTDPDVDLCVMLALEANEPIMALQRELVELLKGYSEYEVLHRKAYEDQFRPHLTLTSAELDRQAYEQILAELPSDYTVEGVVEEIQLLSKADPDQLHPDVITYHL